MKQKKKILKFKKIKIANVNFIKGGVETDSAASDTNTIQSGNGCPPGPNEASDINNPCSDGCYVSAVREHQNSEGKDGCFLGYCLN